MRLLVLIALVLLLVGIIGGLAFHPLLWLFIVVALIVGAIGFISGGGRRTA